MNKYLTALVILIGSVSGVANAACGPNGCSANSEQFNAIYGDKPAAQKVAKKRPATKGYSTQYGNGQPKSCNCSRN